MTSHVDSGDLAVLHDQASTNHRMASPSRRAEDDGHHGIAEAARIGDRVEVEGKEIGAFPGLSEPISVRPSTEATPIVAISSASRAVSHSLARSGSEADSTVGAFGRKQAHLQPGQQHRLAHLDPQVRSVVARRTVNPKPSPYACVAIFRERRDARCEPHEAPGWVPLGYCRSLTPRSRLSMISSTPRARRSVDWAALLTPFRPAPSFGPDKTVRLTIKPRG
jgi:hypothetical protein